MGKLLLFSRAGTDWKELGATGGSFIHPLLRYQHGSTTTKKLPRELSTAWKEKREELLSASFIALYMPEG
jgi:hypothetical protein